MIDIIRTCGTYTIAGLIDSFRKRGEYSSGIPILGTDSDFTHVCSDHNIKGLIIAIGDNYQRSRIAREILLMKPNANFVTAIHPTAYVASDAIIGAGSVLMPGSVVNTGSRVGSFCIINTNASLDHDCTMEDFSSMAPGVSTGGNCVIGNHSAICVGASLAHGIRIGSHSVVGAGSTVLCNIDSHHVAYGTPAAPIRKRHEGDKYL